MEKAKRGGGKDKRIWICICNCDLILLTLTWEREKVACVLELHISQVALYFSLYLSWLLPLHSSLITLLGYKILGRSLLRSSFFSLSLMISCYIFVLWFSGFILLLDVVYGSLVSSVFTSWVLFKVSSDNFIYFCLRLKNLLKT